MRLGTADPPRIGADAEYRVRSPPATCRARPGADRGTQGRRAFLPLRGRGRRIRVFARTPHGRDPADDRRLWDEAAVSYGSGRLRTLLPASRRRAEGVSIAEGGRIACRPITLPRAPDSAALPLHRLRQA